AIRGPKRTKPPNREVGGLWPAGARFDAQRRIPPGGPTTSRTTTSRTTSTVRPRCMAVVQHAAASTGMQERKNTARLRTATSDGPCRRAARLRTCAARQMSVTRVHESVSSAGAARSVLSRHPERHSEQTESDQRSASRENRDHRAWHISGRELAYHRLKYPRRL